MILNRDKAKYSENTLFQCQCFHHKYHVGSNHDFRDEMPVTVLLSHGTALSLIFVVAATDNEFSKNLFYFCSFSLD